jgi:hypothetical protein
MSISYVIHICNSVCYFWMEAKLCYCLLLYVLSLEILLSSGEWWDSINRFNLVIFCSCPKARRVFLLAYVTVYFVFNSLRWEVIVYFVDIGGIVAHHCLNHNCVKARILVVKLYKINKKSNLIQQIVCQNTTHFYCLHNRLYLN